MNHHIIFTCKYFAAIAIITYLFNGLDKALDNFSLSTGEADFSRLAEERVGTFLLLFIELTK